MASLKSYCIAAAAGLEAAPSRCLRKETRQVKSPYNNTRKQAEWLLGRIGRKVGMFVE